MHTVDCVPHISFTLSRMCADEDHDAQQEEDAVFNNWLHRSLSRLDAIVLSLFTLYWVHQTWLSGGHPSEMLVLLLIACLLAFRIFYAAHTQHAEQQSSTERLLRVASAVDGCAHVPLLMSNDAESDGVRWCICLLVAHAVEAGTIALGRTSRVLSIAQPRLDHRELAQAICMLIGLMHGVRPIPRRLKLCTATAFELIFFLWLAPCMPLHPDGHPALLPSGAINVDWIKLVGGCAVFFALGYVVSWQMLAHVVRPLWQTHVAQIERLTAEKDRLSAEKDRLLYDFYLADDRRTRAEGEVVRLQSIGSGDGGSTRESGTPRSPRPPSYAPSVRSDSFGVGGSSTAGTNAELSDLTARAELLQGEGTGYMAFLRFRSDEIEFAYLTHHFRLHVPLIRRFTSTVWAFVALCTVASLAQWRWFPMFEFFACHPSQTCKVHANTFVPLVVNSLIMWVVHSRWLTCESYQRIVAFSAVAFVWAFTDFGPALGSCLGSDFGPQYRDLCEPLNVAATSSCQGIAVHAAWQVAGVNAFMTGTSLTLGLEPLAALCTALVCGFLLHRRSQLVSSTLSDTELPPLLALHCMALLTLTFACYARAHLERREFMTSATFRAMKNKRIEQVEQVRVWGTYRVQGKHGAGGA